MKSQNENFLIVWVDDTGGGGGEVEERIAVGETGWEDAVGRVVVSGNWVNTVGGVIFTLAAPETIFFFLLKYELKERGFAVTTW